VDFSVKLSKWLDWANNGHPYSHGRAKSIIETILQKQFSGSVLVKGKKEGRKQGSIGCTNESMSVFTLMLRQDKF